MIFLAIVGTSPLTLDEALAYQKLKPLHSELRDMSKETAMLCVGPQFTFGLHFKPAIRTYADPGSLKHAQQSQVTAFPVGSIFVKEKFDAKDAKVPSQITVMKKVEKGKGAKTWHYMLIDIKSKKLVQEWRPDKPAPADKPKRQTDCVGCHVRWDEHDGISTTGFLLAIQKK